MANGFSVQTSSGERHEIMTHGVQVIQRKKIFDAPELV